MHSSYYNSSSDSSISSADSYRRRHRHKSKSKSRDKLRHTKDVRKLSPLLMRHDLDIRDDKPRSYRKKYSSSRDDELDYSSREQGSTSTVSREELKDIKRRHEKELKNLMKFVEKESSLLSGIEEEKREELHKMRREHEKEVRRLFEYQEKELAIISEKHTRMQAELEDRLELVQRNAREELQRCKDDAYALEEELQTRTQKSNHELRELNNELSTSLRNTSILENELKILKEQLANKDKYITQLEEANVEKDKCILKLEGANAKLAFTEENLRGEIRRREDDIRRKDRTISQKNDEIRSLSSRASSREQVDCINISGHEWEETSGLTAGSEFDFRKDPLEKYRQKPPSKYRFSPDKGRKTTYSSSKRRENRDDMDTRKLSVSFSDEVERRYSQTSHDSLSRRLENLYLEK